MKRTLVATSLLLSGFVWVASYPQPVIAATCYQDDKGRLSQRRRPGYKRVECPAPEPVSNISVGTDTPEVDSGETKASDIKPAFPVRTGGSATAGRRVEEVREQRRQKEAFPMEVEEGGRPPRVRNAISPIKRPSLEDYPDSVEQGDRWRIVDPFYQPASLLDPYNRNILKGDKPLHDDWFFSLNVVSDTIVELRDSPTGVGSSSTLGAGDIDVFGDAEQSVFSQTLLAELVYYKGDTVFRPPDHEYRFIPVLNFNRVELEENQGVNAAPSRGSDRDDNHFGIQAAFYDRHLRNVSDNYDFDSLRIGIQPFSSDFRGFLFQDAPFGFRLFGNRSDNIFQYNVGLFRRIEKDTNSGLNDVGAGMRNEDLLTANLYWQDLFVKGFTSQFSLTYVDNREGDEFHFNKNDFIERPASLGREAPRDYKVLYLGYSGDGHFGRTNLSTSAYIALGEESAGTFVDTKTDIAASFAAAELSVDFDWVRPRLSFLYGSGDSDPYDDKATGFDAIFENPQFAGGDSSYWNRQSVPLVAGGRVGLSGRNGLLNSLRSTKEEGQANYTNPGILLLGAGVDLDLTPQLRLSFNANDLYFDDTAVLEAARNQGAIDRHIGLDLSTSIIYRPFMSQNIVFRASYAKLLAGDGYDDLFPDEDPSYLLLNLALSY